jgi:dihydropteroate synthase
VGAHPLEQVWQRRGVGVMGIVNATPDSFADGGRFPSAAAAVEHALALAAAGADVIDIGGESTRPGAEPVDEATERERVLPVIGELVRRGLHCPISIDTSKASVARAALAAGACIVNDVSAGGDPEMFAAVRAHDAAVVLMHRRGEPHTMQRDTRYTDVVAEVHAFLAERAEAALRAGIPAARILLDPGIGFGKDAVGNLRLLRALPDLASLGFGVVVGASRKSFIGTLSGANVGERLPGSLAAVSAAAGLTRALVRVHDVAASLQFLTVLAAIRAAA